jgi:hypothetical protein
MWSPIEVNLEELEQMSFNELGDLFKRIKIWLFKNGLYPVKDLVSREIEIYHVVQDQFTKMMDAIPIIEEEARNSYDYRVHIIDQ